MYHLPAQVVHKWTGKAGLAEGDGWPISTIASAGHRGEKTVEYATMWNVVGHERAVSALTRLVSRDRLPHALLFVGQSGIGKTRLALELAKALNCTGAAPPCQQCVQCRQIEARSHPDVSVIERSDGKDSILIQQIRELREAAALRPFQARTKVYVVAGAETLTAQAADALLKTLEEPPLHVVIILTAAEETLPATVVSRCRVMALQGVPTSRVARALEEAGQERDEAVRVARLACGNVGWALGAAKQPKLIEQREELVDRLSKVLDLSLDGRLDLAERLVADRKDRSTVRRSLEVLMLLARDLLLLGRGLPAELASGAQEAALAQQVGRFSLYQIHDYVQRLRLTMARIDQNVDPRLALEALMVNLP